MKHTSIIFIIIALLSGCASTTVGRAYLADRAKEELVGKSKHYILRCAGAPIQKETFEDMEFLTYYSTDYVKRDCTVTFALRDGKVEKVSYSGDTGGLLVKGQHCAYIIEDCLED